MKIYVALLGKEPVPIYYPIKMFEADVVYLIGTNENIELMSNLQTFLSPLICNTKFVDAYKPIEVKEFCESLHSTHPDDEFLYNLVGGTKPMSIAAFLVAYQYNARTIYTTTTNQILEIPSYQTTDMDCEITNEELIKLQGQNLKSYDDIKSIPTQIYYYAKYAYDFIVHEKKVYERISNYYRKFYKSKVVLQNLIFDNIKCVGGKDDFLISVDGKTVFQLNYEHSFSMVFEGRWWEVLVSMAVKKWNESNNDSRQIWRNVKFIQKEGDRDVKKDKNEVDILVNIRTKLLFVECKSGEVTQDNIYRFSRVRDVYGGQMSKAILVSFYNINPELHEKANDCHVDIFECKGKLDNLGNRFGVFISDVLRKKGV